MVSGVIIGDFVGISRVDGFRYIFRQSPSSLNQLLAIYVDVASAWWIPSIFPRIHTFCSMTDQSQAHALEPSIR